ncbi:MAG TPA: hypothetical protein EYN38_10745 [Flavobacteriales bacterium]|nr:hypothetical protein [Flavobacteriales bacterium]HIA12944.1 hypothetical protein [Flavobacteriales bacterium]HIO73568.1 hypothetical protein [Flavobacteriales bacterium]
MKNTLFTLIVAAILVSCSSKDNTIEAIGELEIKLYSENTTVFDKDIADKLVATYRDFVSKYPEDEKSPEYLFKAAEVSMGMESSESALACYKQVYTDYPDYAKASTALFLEGFVYETQTANLVMAQKCYNEFMDKYPNHTLADDAKFSVENLGKSDEEIIREFEEKLKNKAIEGTEENDSTETNDPEIL